MKDSEPKRKAAPSDDGLLVQRVEMNFYMPVYITQAQQWQLQDVMNAIVKADVNQFEGHVHWISGIGQKPKWSKADAAFLGERADTGAPDTGEPEFDESTFELSTYCREAHPSEHTGSSRHVIRCRFCKDDGTPCARCGHD